MSDFKSLDGRCILIVDDEPDVREITEMILRLRGATTLAAADGFEALRLVKEHGKRIDAVLLDLNMPVISGAETLEELRQLQPQVPIVISTGFVAEGAELESLMEKSNVRILEKPFGGDDLVRKLLGDDDRRNAA